MGFVCVGVSWVASSGKLLICWNSWIRWVICSASQKAFSSTWHPQPTAPHTGNIAWFFGFWLLSMLANNKMNYARNEMLAHEKHMFWLSWVELCGGWGWKQKHLIFHAPRKKKTFSPRIFHSTMERFSLLLNIHELSWFEHDLFIWKNSICWVLGGGNVRRQFIATDMSANWNGGWLRSFVEIYCGSFEGNLWHRRFMKIFWISSRELSWH